MRVQRILVKGLFGRFDHDIRMNLVDRITIIHGPNGFGKTALLKLISGLFSGSNDTLLSIPFRELRVEFEDGRSISITKLHETTDQRVGPSGLGLRFSYKDESETYEVLLPVRRPDPREIPVHLVDDLIPELDREGPELWRNLRTGELLSLTDVAERYWERLPGSVTGDSPSPPDWLKAVRQSVPVRFIQAERLQAEARIRRVRHTHRSTSRAARLYSEELGDTIKQVLTEYAALSQSLDRTFPARVVTVTRESYLPLGKLRTALNEIEAKRARLVEAGLLEREGGDTTVQVLQHMDDTKIPVLSVYVQDTDQKLSVFDPLVAKVELFKKSINDRFQYKQVSIGKEGFAFTTAEGDPLDPVNLSSGEQHEIVLLYQLLFKATENSLLLVDEPELSLHVAWQEQFLSDLKKITALSGFDALIATHSPQIISDRWDLTVDLKGPRHEVLTHTAQLSK